MPITCAMYQAATYVQRPTLRENPLGLTLQGTCEAIDSEYFTKCEELSSKNYSHYSSAPQRFHQHGTWCHTTISRGQWDVHGYKPTHEKEIFQKFLLFLNHLTYSCLVTSKIVHSQVWSQFSALMDVTTSHGWLLWTLMQILLKGHRCFGWFIMYVSFLRHSLNLNVWKLMVSHWYNHIVNICPSVQATAS